MLSGLTRVIVYWENIMTPNLILMSQGSSIKVRKL